MEINLKNKVAIVTGSTEGIGHAIALIFAEYGADVYINGRNSEKAGAAVKLFTDKNLRANLLLGDATSEKFIKESIEKIVRGEKKIDILVNNVGLYGLGKPIENVTTKEWQKYINANLTSTFLWTREIVPQMKAQKSGKIINISSIAGISGFGGTSPYNAAKGGIIALTKGLAKELGPWNININAIAPGVILSEGVKKEIKEDASATTRLEAIKQRTPLRRLGKPENVAHAALFLASSLSDFITGEVISINGGH